MAKRICKHGNCQKLVEGGEGVTVSGAGYREKFCSWDHAARWTLAMAHRTVSPADREARFLHALAALDGFSWKDGVKK